MHPLDLGSALARQHIEDLHREAAVRRLVRSSRRHNAGRRESSRVGLQPAPAPRSN